MSKDDYLFYRLIVTCLQTAEHNLNRAYAACEHRFPVLQENISRLTDQVENLAARLIDSGVTKEPA